MIGAWLYRRSDIVPSVTHPLKFDPPTIIEYARTELAARSQKPSKKSWPLMLGSSIFFKHASAHSTPRQPGLSRRDPNSADRVAARPETVVASRPHSVVILPTGSTPSGFCVVTLAASGELNRVRPFPFASPCVARSGIAACPARCQSSSSHPAVASVDAGIDEDCPTGDVAGGACLAPHPSGAGVVQTRTGINGSRSVGPFSQTDRIVRSLRTSPSRKPRSSSVPCQHASIEHHLPYGTVSAPSFGLHTIPPV